MGNLMGTKFILLLILLSMFIPVMAQKKEAKRQKDFKSYLILGGRAISLSENDIKIAEYIQDGNVQHATEHIINNWKNLEACIGFRAIQGEDRRKLLTALFERGFVDINNSWDHYEILITDPLKHFPKLLPTLKLEDLHKFPTDQILPILSHQDFPKNWYKEERCAWLAVRLLKNSKNEIETLNKLLKIGITPSAIIKTQKNSYSNEQNIDASIAYLFQQKLLDLKDSDERKTIFGFLLSKNQKPLWESALEQNFRWSTEVDKNGSSIEKQPRNLKSFAEWRLLQKHLGLNLYHPKLFKRILLYSLNKEDFQEAKLFLEKAPMRQVNYKGQNLLGHACSDWLPLLIKAGLDPQQRDNKGNTLLHHEDSIKSLQILIDAGADAKVLNKLGDSALFGRENIKALEILLKAGADPHIRSKDGKTIWNQLDLLSYESFSPQTEIDGKVLTEPLIPIINFLLKNKINPELTDGEGKTPLMHFAIAGKPLIVSRLLEHGVMQNTKDKYGRNALEVLLKRTPQETKNNPEVELEVYEYNDYLEENRIICMWILKNAGITTDLKADDPLINNENWAVWEEIKKTNMLPQEALTILLSYDIPELSQVAIKTNLKSLNKCVDACAWKSAIALLKSQPALVSLNEPFSKTLQLSLKKKKATTIISHCVRSSGIRQKEFDSFHKFVNELSKKP